MMPSKDEALARRRTQTRLAQRRYRAKLRREKQKRLEQPNNGAEDGGKSQSESDDSPVTTALNQHACASVHDDAPPLADPEPRPVPFQHANPAIANCRFALFGNAALLSVWGERKRDNVSRAPSGTRSDTRSNDILGNVETSRVTTDDAARQTSTEAPLANPALDPLSVFADFSAEHLALIETEQQQLQASLAQLTPIPRTSKGDFSPTSDPWLSVLHMAALRGHSQIIRALLKHPGADCNEKDSDGCSPLYYAIVNGSEDTVQALLDHGADMREAESSQKRSALHLAVMEQNEGMLRLLLEHCSSDPALVNSYDGAGMTPLHTAVDTGFEAGVHLLLQHGASITDKAARRGSKT